MAAVKAVGLAAEDLVAIAVAMVVEATDTAAMTADLVGRSQVAVVALISMTISRFRIDVYRANAS